MSVHDFEEVLSFWLGELDELGVADAATRARWWKKSDDFDADVLARFEATRRAICAGDCAGWLGTARGRVAYVIVLDQLSRNMFRGTPEMYTEDNLALSAAVEGIEAGCEGELGYHERYFLYMPLMHAEDLGAQDRCVALFESMKTAYPNKATEIQNVIGFAEKHRVIVARFGRFPHRNEIVGRESTAEEIEFLKGPGSSF
ncbi:DUF924 domain-containing protein [bacterium AH-315-N03]|nr:DUF924 domain-containing protein [bacterium AH-315-N03]